MSMGVYMCIVDVYVCVCVYSIVYVCVCVDVGAVIQVQVACLAVSSVCMLDPCRLVRHTVYCRTHKRKDATTVELIWRIL